MIFTPIYENVFDYARSSMTYASQEGVFFSAPALPATGSHLLRSIYAKTGIHISALPVSTIRSAFQQKDINESLLRVFQARPLQVLPFAHTGFITPYFALGAYASTKVTTEFREFSTDGLPQLWIQNHAQGGILGNISFPIIGNFYGGISPKFVFFSDIREDLGLNQLESLNLSKTIKTLRLKPQYHIDSQILYKSSIISLSLLHHEPLSLIHAGVGLTFRNSLHGLHLGTDLKDIQNVSHTHWTRRFSTHCTYVFQKWLGLSYGIRDGSIAYSIALRLLVLRLEASMYTEDFGTYLNTQPVNHYALSLGMELG